MTLLIGLQMFLTPESQNIEVTDDEVVKELLDNQLKNYSTSHNLYCGIVCNYSEDDLDIVSLHNLPEGFRDVKKPIITEVINS